MTDNHVHAKKRLMGRTKLFHENINLTLPKGSKARMDAVCTEAENRLDLIREAIDREIKRREKKAKSETSELTAEEE